MAKTVETDLRDGICTVTLNRPQRLNAINLQLILDLSDALAAANRKDGVRAVVLRGAGRAFCSGDDLKDFDQQAPSEPDGRRLVEALQGVTREMVLGDKIVVGAIHGWAVGGGLEWALNCDFPIWGAGARGFFPEIGLGLFVTGGVTALLPRLAGLPRAKELILFGERFGAEEALAAGIAWRVVPDDVVFTEARGLAARIAALPHRQTTDLKRVINRACHRELEHALALETDAAVRAFLDPETARRVAAFGGG